MLRWHVSLTRKNEFDTLNNSTTCLLDRLLARLGGMLYSYPTLGLEIVGTKIASDFFLWLFPGRSNNYTSVTNYWAVQCYAEWQDDTWPGRKKNRGKPKNSKIQKHPERNQKRGTNQKGSLLLLRVFFSGGVRHNTSFERKGTHRIQYI